MASRLSRRRRWIDYYLSDREKYFTNSACVFVKDDAFQLFPKLETNRYQNLEEAGYSASQLLHDKIGFVGRGGVTGTGSEDSSHVRVSNTQLYEHLNGS